MGASSSSDIRDSAVQTGKEERKSKFLVSRLPVCLTRLPFQAALTDGDADVEEEQLLAALRCN